MNHRNLPARGQDKDIFFRDFDRFLPSRLLRMFGDDELEGLAGWKPAVDVKENDKEYVITADIPGVEPNDVDVRLEGNTLTVSGERKTEERDDRNGYRRVERFEGSFYRALTLPDASDAEQVEASAKDGVITIRIPKSAGRQAKRIKISS